MIEEQAQVVEAGGGFAWVETQRQSACGSCNARSVCGSAALARVLGQRRSRVRVLSDLPLKPGDRVLIGLQEGALVRGSLVVYLLPLAALLLGAILGRALGGEGLSIAGGLLGLALGFGRLQGFGRAIGGDPRFQPVVLRRFEGQPLSPSPYSAEAKRL
ncbi:MAG: SoxR reducing system RseC family protein [Candidatus Competibacteraceae bacterium]|nr:SoxR reducing system RseC family protein [Candidatus Competibacteraceae bacterium]